MLNDNALGQAELAYPFKPIRNAGEELNVRAVFGKSLLVEYYVTLRLLHHFEHVSKIAVHVVCGCHFV